MEFKFLKSKKLVVGVVLVTLLVVLFSFDEELNPEIPKLIESINTEVSTAENGMVFLLGMGTNTNKTPYEIGLERIQNYHLRKEPSYAEAYDPLEDSSSEMWLPELEGGEDVSNLMCYFLESECLHLVWINRSEIPSLIEEHADYLDVVNQLIEYETFRPVVMPNISAPMVFHNNSLFSHKLKLLEIVHFFAIQDYSSAFTELTKLIQLHQNLLAQSPQLIVKVVAIVQYQATLEVAAFLLTKTDSSNINVWEGVETSLTQFEPSVASQQRQFSVEFVGMVNAIKETTELNGESIDVGPFHLTQSLAYKPNMTINLLYKTLMGSVNTYEWSNGRIERTKPKREKGEMAPLQITNYVGSLLVRTAVPRFLDIESDILELYFRNKVLQASIDARKKFKAPKVDQIDIISPYTGLQAFLKNEKLCVDPAADESEDLCFYF